MEAGVLTLAQSGAEQLVSFWAHAGELPWFVDTLELTQVAGVAALIDVCQVTCSGFINCPPLMVKRESRQCWSPTVTSKAIRPQLVALVTATEEGAVCVVAPLGAGGTHVAFIHIWKEEGFILELKANKIRNDTCSWLLSANIFFSISSFEHTASKAETVLASSNK